MSDSTTTTSNRWDDAESFIREFGDKRQAIVDEWERAQENFPSVLNTAHAEYNRDEDPLPCFNKFIEHLNTLTQLRLSLLTIGVRVHFDESVALLALEVLPEIVHTKTGWPMWSLFVPRVIELIHPAQLPNDACEKWFDDNIFGAASSHAALARAEARIEAKL